MVCPEGSPAAGSPTKIEKVAAKMLSDDVFIVFVRQDERSGIVSNSLNWQYDRQH
jgi:hypothetical protein